MTWFRVDDSFYDHPKVFDAPDCAVALWTRAGTWSARNLTDGFVPSAMTARFCSDPVTAARELVRRGLWFKVKGGWQFHDWHDYQPTRQAVENSRKLKTQRQNRWREAKRRRSVDAPVDASTPPSQDASVDASPTRPAPKEAGRAGPSPNARKTRAAANGRASPPGSPAHGGKPPWCGTCDEATRLTGDPPARCPRCHPLAVAAEGPSP